MSKFVRVTYSARTDGRVVFESEDAPLVLGEKLLFPKLESELDNMKNGEEKELALQPADAFGARSADMVKLVPLAVFRKNGVDPKPGMVVNVENITGRVQSVSGGRVRIDFNHELAGKTLIMLVKLLRHVDEPEEKTRILFEYNFGKEAAKELSISGDENGLKLNPTKSALALEDFALRKASFLKAFKKTMGETKVAFVENY
ncbi:peptidylprolyl isomerase [archaeon]|nr:peptidylprolyl isomerase [archaeon]